MSQKQAHPQLYEPPAPVPRRLTIADFARQHAGEVRDPEELAAEVWGSDDELDYFLADLRASRGASTS